MKKQIFDIFPQKKIRKTSDVRLDKKPLGRAGASVSRWERPTDSRVKQRGDLRSRVKVIADYREKNSLVTFELIGKGLEVEFKQLKVADYLIDEIAIERKTVSDFVSSMINKRLFNQLQEIKQYPVHLLIVEGIEEQELYNDFPEGINGNAIRGMLLSIVLKYKVPIIFSKDSKDTASFINILARKKDKKDLSLNPKKKSLNVKEQKQFILEGFPGIGPTTAKKLLKEFKTIRNIINASQEDLQKIIGKKAEIFKLVKEKY